MFVGEPVTRRRSEQTGVDRYGNPVYSTTETVLDQRAAFDPGGSREPVEVGREQVVTTPKLYFLRTWPDLLEQDEVMVRGRWFTVQGVPADWRSPYESPLGGMVVELQEVTG